MYAHEEPFLYSKKYMTLSSCRVIWHYINIHEGSLLGEYLSSIHWISHEAYILLLQVCSSFDWCLLWRSASMKVWFSTTPLDIGSNIHEFGMPSLRRQKKTYCYQSYEKLRAWLRRRAIFITKKHYNSSSLSWELELKYVQGSEPSSRAGGMPRQHSLINNHSCQHCHPYWQHVKNSSLC
jgi:hypothetical protein